MKNISKIFALLILSLFYTGRTGLTQTYNSPVAYLNDISKETKDISKATWNYISATAHAKRARTVDNKRKSLLKTISQAVRKISEMSDYNGDASLRDSTAAYFKLMYLVLNRDYDKIMNMEDIAEQSYDLMEAYLLAKQTANKKLDEASDRWNQEVKDFAAENKITLVNKEDELGRNLSIASEVNKYYNTIYLIFFKSYKQELYVLDALQRNDMNALEQNKNTLVDFSDKGLAKLDTIKSYKNDGSLRTACMQLLNFYNKEAKEKIDVFIDYNMKKENFENIKAAFDAKNSMARTQEDINQYNGALKDLNNATNQVKRTNIELNNNRKRLMTNWTNAVSSFMQRHIPKD